jgi:cytochrome c2
MIPATRLVVAAILLLVLPARAAQAPEVERARYLWSQSPHGRMLERLLPPSLEPGELPEPRSAGARLTARYCIQCHYLPNPQMHSPARWLPVVERMVWRMRGEGNMGTLMKDMMAGVRAPDAAETETLVAYLRRHGQREIDPQHPALDGRAGQIYSLACSQCHALPDPQRHSAREWPSVVKRMQGHMAWANTVTGVAALRTNPELDTAEIVRLLQRHARR